MQEISVGAIIFYEKHVLLIHQKHGNHIGFPKGHVEVNETPSQTAIREVQEEVGLSITLTPHTYDVFYQPTPSIHKKVTYFLAYATSQKVHIQVEEIHRAFWVTLDNALKQLTYENDKNALTYMMTKYAEDGHDYRNS